MPPVQPPTLGEVGSMEGSSEEVLRAVFEAMAEGVVCQDRSGAIVACNPSAERILGLTRDQMMGRTSTDLRWQAVHEDGSPFPGDTHPAMVTLQTGEPCSNVVMGVHRPDEGLAWILINSKPIMGADGKPTAVVTTFFEVTQFRELRDEKDRLAGELERALTKALSGFLPICANCKSIRNRDDEWIELEDFLSAKAGTEFSHTVCPTCFSELYPGMEYRVDKS
jgi:PAS domain S-box-containing protein